MPIEWAGPGLLEAMGGRETGFGADRRDGKCRTRRCCWPRKGALTFPHVATPLLVATVAAVVLWVLGLLVAAFATRAGASIRGRRPWTWARSRRRSSTC